MPDGNTSLGSALSQIPSLVALAAWIVLCLAEAWFQAAGLRQPESPRRERKSFYACTMSFRCVVLFSFIDAILLQCTTIDSGLWPICYGGCGLLVAGIALRIVSRWTLGKQFSAYVQTTENHRLVTRGIYRFIRHPAYLGSLCLLLGFPLCLGSAGGLGIAVLAGIPALLYRIRVEEMALREWFGDEYAQYQRRTRRLIPLLW